MNGINSNHCGSIAVLTVVFLSLNDPHICRDETNPCMRTENKHMYTDSTEILYSCMILLFSLTWWNEGKAGTGVVICDFMISYFYRQDSFQSCKGGGAMGPLPNLAVLLFSFLDIGLLSSPSRTGARTGDMTSPLPDMGPTRVSVIP